MTVMSIEKVLQDLKIEVTAGSSLISHPPLFTYDSKNLLLVQGNKIQIYDTSTSSPLSAIFLPDPAETIANICLCPKSPEKFVLICSSSGIIYELKLTTEKLKKRDEIISPKTWSKIVRIVNFSCPLPSFYIFLAYTEGKESLNLYVARDTKNFPNLQLESLCGNIIPNHHSISWGGLDKDSGNVLIAANLGKAIYVRDWRSQICRKHLVGNRNVTCVAVHPRESLLATGDVTGRVVVWRNVLERSPPKNVLHWHTLPLADLAFTPEGTQIFSGGGECTLVKWDIENAENRRTIPRLGLPIRHVTVSPSNSHTAISFSDNCVKILDTTNQVTNTIQNISQCIIPEIVYDVSGENSNSKPEKFQAFLAGLNVDPNNSSLIMNGRPGHLQSYSVLEDKHLYTLDVTQQNFITSEREKIVSNTEVTRVSFSKYGVWMATNEARYADGKCTELRLKFWKFHKENNRYILNTSIDWPHEKELKSLRLQPIENDEGDRIMAATSGDDKCFKTWGIIREMSIHGKNEWWNCENIGSYHQLEGGPLGFSQDGSVLGASFGNILTLWNADTHEIKSTLSHSRINEDITLLEFGQNQNSYLAVACTKNHLVVWDVISSYLVWTITLNVEVLVVDPLSNFVAAFSSNKNLYFFMPNSPEPLAVHRNISKSDIISAVFLPRRISSSEIFQLKSTLVFINADQELYVLLPKDDEKEGPSVMLDFDKNAPKTPYAKMIADKTISKVEREAEDLTRQKSGIEETQIIREILEISPHTMPSMSYFCDKFLKAVSSQKRPEDFLAELEALNNKK